MILIADSGATKTAWRLVHSRQDIRSFETNGFNPFFINSASIEDEVAKELVPFIDSHHVKEVFFYGAGCSTIDKCIIVEDGLKDLFSEARIKVEDDLLGAARALFSHQPGIACILGTGSNSCLYDGKKITENIPSLGYLLGDEGSGAYIGKRLLREVFTLSAPADVRALFEKKYNYTRVDILNQIYQRPLPNRFLSSFMPFIRENISHPFIVELVKHCFRDFFEMQVLKYSECRNMAISCTGSIAHYFAEQLREVAIEKNLEIKNIVQTPIEGLTEYHLVDLEKFTAIRYSSDMES
jgi:glucosamine kinase